MASHNTTNSVTIDITTAADRLDHIKRLLSEVDDRIGPDSSLRWLIKEVDRLRAQQEIRNDELKILYALLERMVKRLGEAFIINPVITDPDQLTEMVIHRSQGHATELAEIHDLTAEALGYQRAPSLEEDPDCPCPGQFITGEHTAQTLVMELIKKYKDQQLTINNLSHQIEVITREVWKTDG